MAQRISLRDYQKELAERLRAADSARAASRLGLQVGAQNWLVDLADAGEVMPVPPITAVPLTRPWFRGVANVRGNLYSVIDFAAFLGAGLCAGGEQARLVLLGERFRSAAALLVERSLGLRNPQELRRAEGETGAPWIKAQYTDDSGAAWSEIDVPALVRAGEFLAVGV